MSSRSSSSSSSSSASGSHKHAKGEASGKSRAWIFTVQTDFDTYSPTPMPRELADLITFGVGQVEGSSADGFSFVAYLELASQERSGAAREWLATVPDVLPAGGSEGEDDEDPPLPKIWARSVAGRPVFLKDRKAHIARYTSVALRVVPEGELIARASWVHGAAERAAPGQRTDFEEIREVLREHGPMEGIRQVAEKFPGQFVRYASGITQLADLVVPKVPESEDFQLRPWQACLVEILRGPAHDRHIYWIEDGQGGEGKSRLSTYLCRTMNAIELDGRITDCAFAYTGQPIAIFDLARPVDVLQLRDLYTVAEKLKNGQLVSTKYQSKLKVFKVPHVVFFSNHSPPLGVWSADRVQHIVLSPSPPFQAHSGAGAGAPPPPPSGADLFKKLMKDREAAERAAAEQAEAEEEDAEAARERDALRLAGQKRQREMMVARKGQLMRRGEEEEEEGDS
jgi:hypothetical protein